MPPRNLGPTLDPEEHAASLADHNQWRAASDAHRKAAELIWPIADSGASQLAQHAAHVQSSVGRRRAPGVPMALVLLVEFGAACGSYLLNAGLAIETLLKAVRVKRLRIEKKPIAFGGGPDQLPKRHEYVRLAEHELGSLSTGELEILERLGIYVTWAGRYPMALEPPSLKDLQRRGCSPADRNKVEALYRRILDRYESLA
jgi:hypothetical protein